MPDEYKAARKLFFLLSSWNIKKVMKSMRPMIRTYMRILLATENPYIHDIEGDKKKRDATMNTRLSMYKNHLREFPVKNTMIEMVASKIDIPSTMATRRLIDDEK
jgi:hypothetical protein